MVEQPNILMILTDQQRADAFGASGNGEIFTPNFDRLAASGVRCTRAFTESPECVPARSIILSGQTALATGSDSNRNPLPLDVPTFPRALRDAGYDTWAVGKQHFMPPRADYGYRRLVLSDPAGGDYLAYLVAAGYGWVHEPTGVRHELYYVPQPSQLPDAHHVTTWTGDRALEELARAARGGTPFFGVASFLKPHPPFDPTIPFLTRYDPDALQMPVPAADGDQPFVVELAQSFMKWREETGAPLTRTLRAYYYAVVTQVDVQVGRILDALDELALRDNTLVLFLSDHGELLGDHGQWGKRSFLEGSSRIPFVLSWPGRLPAGVAYGGLVGQQDVAPTVLAAAGLGAAATPLPGRNVVAEIAGRSQWEKRDALVGALNRAARAIVGVLTERWRWSYGVAGATERLFDLDSDPLEQMNLATSPDHADLVHGMRQTALKAIAEHGDRLSLLEGDDLVRLAIPPEPHRLIGRNRQYAAAAEVIPPTASGRGF